MKRIVLYFALALLLIMSTSVPVIAQSLVFDYENVTVVGEILRVKWEHISGEWLESWVLALKVPVTISFGKNLITEDSQVMLSFIDLDIPDETIFSTWSDKQVRITGEAMEAHTAYHIRDIVLIVSDVSVVSDGSTPGKINTGADNTSQSQNQNAAPTNSTVIVDDEEVSFDAYEINDNNYFKLRDLAFILSGSKKQFAVGWDEVNNAISLTSGQPYIAVGGEMTGGNPGNKTAVNSTSKLYLDGTEISLTAYNIENNNYFKLRDIGMALDFGILWDEARNTIVVTTNDGYNTSSTENTDTSASNSTDTANNFAAALQEFTKAATGNVSAVLYDLDGCGSDEMILFDEGIDNSPEHWAANAQSSRLVVYDSKKIGNTPFSTIELPEHGLSSSHFYISKKNHLVLKEEFEGISYVLLKYENGILSEEIRLVDASGGGDTFFLINGVECDEAQYSSKVKEYDPGNIAVTIAAGDMQLSWHSEDILPTLKDDTQKILNMLTENS